jgi:hypothetical protein
MPGEHLSMAQRRRVLTLAADGWPVDQIRNHPMWAKREKPPDRRTLNRLIAGMTASPDSPSRRTGSRPASNLDAADEWASDHPAPKMFVGDIASTDHLEALRDFVFWCQLFEERPLFECQVRWAHHVDTHQFAQVMAGPRHGKTEACSTLRTVWHLCGGGYPWDYYEEPSNPLRDTQVGMVASSKEQAGKNWLAVAARLEYNEKLISAYGRFRDSSSLWQSSNYALIVAGRQRAILSGDYSLTVIGERSRVLGRGFNRLKLDDIADLENCRTPEDADAIIRWLRVNIFTRLDDAGAEISCTGAELPLENSPYKQIETMPSLEEADDEDEFAERRPIFATIRDPTVLDWGNKVLLCPEKWNWKRAMAQRSLLGEQIFECVHQQNAAGHGIARFQEDWIHGRGGFPGCLDRDRELGTSAPILRAGVRVPTIRVMSIDPSPTKWCGALVMDIPQQGRVYAPQLIDIRRARMKTPDMLMLLRQWGERYRPRVLTIEKNSADFFIQTEDFQEWRQQLGIRVLYQHTDGKNKNHKEMGFDTLSPDVENGNIRIPWGDYDARYAFQALIDEMLKRLPTDDLLLSLWFPKWWLPALRAMGQTDSFDRYVPGGFVEPPPRLEVVG